MRKAGCRKIARWSSPMQQDTEMPEGFTLSTDAQGITVIEYRSHGMGRMLWFAGTTMVVLVGGWVAFEAADPGLVARLWRDGWFWMVCMTCGALAAVGATHFVLLHALGRTTFRLHPVTLELRRHLLGLSRPRRVRKADMRYVQLYQDGGTGEDTFPSWGLVVRTRRWSCSLLSRQPHEKCAWLGRIVAETYSIKLRQGDTNQS
jgi:hypothetical protein